MLIVILIIILLLGLIKIRKLEKYENQFCRLSNPKGTKKLTPINMILNDIQPFQLSKDKTYNESNIVLSIDEIKQAISNIPINKAPNNFKQIKGVRYNLIDPPIINKISKNHEEYFPNRIFTLIKNVLNKVLITKNKFCNSETSCDLIFIDKRILKIGKNINNTCSEGQILTKLKNRNMEFLFRYVVSDINGFNLHYLELEGHDLKKNIFNDDSWGKYSKYVNIYTEPIVNKYRGSETYIVSSNEKDITSLKVKSKIDERLRYRCYGKTAFNKMDCEKKYDSDGKKIANPGIWDRPCVKDTDCPFYKANKNFTNNLGGCSNNKCIMPVGIETLGPKKHKHISKAYCSNCKKGVNCCVEQQNRRLYPKLKSPDFRYPNDIDVRMNFNL